MTSDPQSNPPPLPGSSGRSGARPSNVLAIVSVALGSAAIGLFMLNDRMNIRGNLGLVGIAVLGLLGIACGIIARILARKIQVVALVGIILSLVEIVASFGLLILNHTTASPHSPGSPFSSFRDRADKIMCESNLKFLYEEIALYRSDHHALPTDIEALATAEGIPSILECPAAKSGRSLDYFYDPAAARAMEAEKPDPTAMVMCDFKGNHPDGSRSVLYADGHVEFLWEEDFGKQLALPQNAAFAAALRAAEGP